MYSDSSAVVAFVHVVEVGKCLENFPFSDLYKIDKNSLTFFLYFV